VGLAAESQPRLPAAKARRQEVETVLDLQEEVGQSAPASLRKEVERVVKQVRLALPALLHFVQELEASQQEAGAQLGEEAVGLIGWAWQRRALLGKQPKDLLEGLRPAWREGASHILAVWKLAVRASSIVENWHRILRPHLAVHRSLSASLLALLAVWHHHRLAPRGVHEGLSPLLHSGADTPAQDWFAVLGYPSVVRREPSTDLIDEDRLAA
jgi:hypothetical protein